MSELYYVHIFCLHYTLYTTNCTQKSWGIGTFVRRAQQIQDIIWLTNQIKIIDTKMD